jgi:molybdate transport system substrate-binding protein
VAVSLEEVIGQLLLDYASQVPDLRVRTVHGASDELADQVLAGAPADLFLTADATQIDRLVQAQRTPGHPQVVLAENGLAAICLTDRSPRVRQAADLARLPGPIALAHASCPLGRYTRDYLTGLQLYEAVAQRALWVENARGAITAIRSGLAEVALAYTSDAARAEGCRVLYRARQLPTPIRYRGVGLRSGESTAAADRLLTFLASPHAATLFRRCGFRNVPRD